MTAAFAEAEVTAGVTDGALGPALFGGNFAEPWPEQPASKATASAAAAPIMGTTDAFLHTVADVTSARRSPGRGKATGIRNAPEILTPLPCP